MELFWSLWEGASGVSALSFMHFDFAHSSTSFGHPHGHFGSFEECAPLASSLSTSMNWNEVTAEVLECCLSALKELPPVWGPSRSIIIGPELYGKELEEPLMPPGPLNGSISDPELSRLLNT